MTVTEKYDLCHLCHHDVILLKYLARFKIMIIIKMIAMMMVIMMMMVMMIYTHLASLTTFLRSKSSSSRLPWSASSGYLDFAFTTIVIIQISMIFIIILVRILRILGFQKKLS